MPTDFETFLATFCIWHFQNTCSSSITPKNRTSFEIDCVIFTQSISISLIEKCKSSFCLFCFVLNRIKFDFFMLIESLLAWNQLDSFFNSYSQFRSVDVGRYEKKIMLVSSAKSMKSKAFDTLHKSLMYYKNNNEPKIDPWG